MSDFFYLLDGQLLASLLVAVRRGGASVLLATLLQLLADLAL